MPVTVVMEGNFMGANMKGLRAVDKGRVMHLLDTLGMKQSDVLLLLVTGDKVFVQPIQRRQHDGVVSRGGRRMKRLVAALVILAAIIGAGIVEAVYVDGTFGELEERIAALESAIKDPGDDALDEVRSLTAWWENKRGKLELFTWSPDIARIFSRSCGNGRLSRMRRRQKRAEQMPVASHDGGESARPAGLQRRGHHLSAGECKVNKLHVSRGNINPPPSRGPHKLPHRKYFRRGPQ